MPKHKLYGVISRYGGFCYGSCLVKFLLFYKTWKEYKNTETKICVNYITMNIGTPENIGIICNNFMFNALHSVDLVAENR